MQLHLRAGFFILFFLLPAALTSFRASSRKNPSLWSISVVSGYTVWPSKKSTKDSIHEWWGGDGQMSLFFSALEISRKFGRYEAGARIQNTGPTFVTPFFKWNFKKRRPHHFALIPSMSFGLVPYHIMGFWLRAEMEFSFRRELGIAPFTGLFTRFKLKDDPQYESGTFIFANTGLRLSLYY